MNRREPLVSEFADDEDMMEILHEFVHGMLTTRRKLDQFVSDANWDEVRRIGHQLKGAGASYGFEEITVAGAALERAVDASEEVDRRVEELITLFERAHAGLAAQRV